MTKKADKGRSVLCIGKKGLSLLVAGSFVVAGFFMPVKAHALENGTPIVAVTVTTSDRTPLEAVPVEREEIVMPDSFVNDYLGFTRTEFVRYLVNHAEAYLATPYTFDDLANPVAGEEGGMQCESFVWSAMFQVATQNRADVPCGAAQTEPLGNGGGWVDWAYYHGVEPIEFDSKSEMLSSGILEKGDIIWSFDAAGPYGISSGNHVGIFWGDTPSDDRFWHCAEEIPGQVFAGRKDGNRITKIQGLVDTPSVWWVFKLSPDTKYKASEWKGKPKVTESVATASARRGTSSRKDEDASEPSASAGSTATASVEPNDTTAFTGVRPVFPVSLMKDIVFYGG